jgi:hypothetical protein
MFEPTLPSQCRTLNSLRFINSTGLRSRRDLVLNRIFVGEERCACLIAPNLINVDAARPHQGIGGTNFLVGLYCKTRR